MLESGVVGTADPDGLIKPVAYVVLKDPAAASPELARELQDFIKKNTAPHKYPRAVTFVDALPKTATGKIKRYKLRERAAEETPLHRGQRSRDISWSPSFSLISSASTSIGASNSIEPLPWIDSNRSSGTPYPRNFSTN